MLRLLSDEDFNGNVVAGVRRHYPDVDLVRAQDGARLEGHGAIVRDKRARATLPRACKPPHF